MSYVSLERAKQHLRADDPEEDLLIQAYIDAACLAAQSYLNRQVFETEEALSQAQDAGDRPMVVNASIQAAVLLIVGDLYENREDSKDAMPLASQRLLDPFRIGQGI